MVKQSKADQDPGLAAKVARIARDALKDIVGRRLLPWPDVYEKEFWSICYREKANDILNYKFRQKEAPKEVVERFLKDAEEILGGVHATLDDFVGGTKEHFGGVEDVLSSLSKKVAGDTALESDVEALIGYNKALREKTEETEKRLDEQSRTIDDLKKRLRVDPLTGLFNRHALSCDLPRELSRSRRYGYPLSIMMIDVDDFKEINDTYGHITGDKILKSLGGILKGGLRDSDSVYRYGGEEFLVVLPHTDCKAALKLGERLRQQVRRYRFIQEKGEKGISITISIGVTEAGVDDDFDILIRRADKALYESKMYGKDQTTRLCPASS